MTSTLTYLAMNSVVSFRALAQEPVRLRVGTGAAVKARTMHAAIVEI